MDVSEKIKEVLGGEPYFRKRDGRYFVDVIFVLRALDIVCDSKGYFPNRMNLLPLSGRTMRFRDLSSSQARFDMGALWNISLGNRSNDTREVHRMGLNKNGEFTIVCT